MKSKKSTDASRLAIGSHSAMARPLAEVSSLTKYTTLDAVVNRLGTFWIDSTSAIPRVCLRVDQNHLNPIGTLHGGVGITVMDALFVEVAGRLDVKHRVFTTVTLNVEYLAAARVGDWLEFVPTIDRIGRHLAFASGRVFSGNDSILRASSVLKAL
jgi:acyl-coenzyme A thioesterase 13